MKRTRLTMAVAIVVGLFAAVPAIAQTQAAGVDDLRLAITINRLNLTPTQMQQVHDILAGIISEADALKEKKDAFTQDMIGFTGSAADLETALSDFRSQMAEQTKAFHDDMKASLDQLKGILTIEQGEILRSAFAQHGFAGSRPIGKGPRSPGLKPMDRGAAVDRSDMWRRPQDDSDAPVWMQRMMAEHPEAAERMAQRFAQRGGRPGQVDEGRPIARLQTSQDREPLFGRLENGDLLATLRRVVDILEVKLQ